MVNAQVKSKSTMSNQTLSKYCLLSYKKREVGLQPVLVIQKSTFVVVTEEVAIQAETSSNVSIV